MSMARRYRSYAAQSAARFSPRSETPGRLLSVSRSEVEPLRPLPRMNAKRCAHRSHAAAEGSAAADDATAATFALRLGAQGNTRTKTMKAFPEEAFLEIVKAI